MRPSATGRPSASGRSPSTTRPSCARRSWRGSTTAIRRRASRPSTGSRYAATPRAVEPALALLAAGDSGRSRWCRHALQEATIRLAALSGDRRFAPICRRWKPAGAGRPSSASSSWRSSAPPPDVRRRDPREPAAADRRGLAGRRLPRRAGAAPPRRSWRLRERRRQPRRRRPSRPRRAGPSAPAGRPAPAAAPRRAARRARAARRPGPAAPGARAARMAPAARASRGRLGRGLRLGRRLRRGCRRLLGRGRLGGRGRISPSPPAAARVPAAAIRLRLAAGGVADASGDGALSIRRVRARAGPVAGRGRRVARRGAVAPAAGRGRRGLRLGRMQAGGLPDRCRRTRSMAFENPSPSCRRRRRPPRPVESQLPGFEAWSARSRWTARRRRCRPRCPARRRCSSPRLHVRARDLLRLVRQAVAVRVGPGVRRAVGVGVGQSRSVPALDSTTLRSPSSSRSPMPSSRPSALLSALRGLESRRQLVVVGDAVAVEVLSELGAVTPFAISQTRPRERSRHARRGADRLQAALRVGCAPARPTSSRNAARRSPTCSPRESAPEAARGLPLRRSGPRGPRRASLRGGERERRAADRDVRGRDGRGEVLAARLRRVLGRPHVGQIHDGVADGARLRRIVVEPAAHGRDQRGRPRGSLTRGRRRAHPRSADRDRPSAGRRAAECRARTRSCPDPNGPIGKF